MPRKTPLTKSAVRIPSRSLPAKCPRCQIVVRWHRYKNTPEAPEAGCGRCGYRILLSDEMLAETYVGRS